MKYLAYIMSVTMLLFVVSACNQISSAKNLEVTGTIQQQGITSYQYGTHTLTNSETFYAIKSDSVDLNQYLNQEVTITAEKLEGYPVDGGPEYLNILGVED